MWSFGWWKENPAVFAQSYLAVDPGCAVVDRRRWGGLFDDRPCTA